MTIQARRDPHTGDVCVPKYIVFTDQHGDNETFIAVDVWETWRSLGKGEIFPRLGEVKQDAGGVIWKVIGLSDDYILVETDDGMRFPCTREDWEMLNDIAV